MSNWAAPSPEETTRPNRDGCLMVGCVIAVGGTVIVGIALLAGVWWLYQLVEAERKVVQGPPPPLVEPTAEEFQADVANGFRKAEVGVDAGTLRSIERFFRDAVRARDKEVGSREVSRLIDGARAVREIEQSANGVRLLRADRASLRQEPFARNPFAGLGADSRIMHVALKEEGSEAIVWGYFADEYGDLQPMRWWLTRDEGNWKLFNWEDCDSGRSEIEEIAIMMSLYYRRRQSWTYYDALAHETVAITSGERPHNEAKKQLESLDVHALDERLFDDGVMRVAFAWYQLGNYDRCLEACDLVKRPEIRPDVDRTRTFCLQQLQRWKEAVQAAERYERLIGPTPIVLVSRATALAELNRPDDAERAWRRVLAVSPAHREALLGWGGLLPEERKEELVKHVSTMPNARRQAQELTESFLNQEDEASALPLAAWLARTAPDSRENLEAQADVKHFEEDYAAAAALYLAAYAKASTDDERRRLQSASLSSMCSVGKHVEAYEQAPDKLAALEAFWSDYRDDQVFGISRVKLAKIVARHKRDHPQDLLAAEIEAHLLAQVHRYAEAEQILTEALGRLSKQADADRENSLKYELVAVLLSQGKWEEAFRQRPEGYELPTMTQQLITDGRLAEARALVENVQRGWPGDQALTLCRAELLLAEQKYSEAWDALPPMSARAARDYPFAWRLDQLLCNLVVKDEASLARFVDRGADNQCWEILAGGLHRRQRWETLREAVKIWGDRLQSPSGAHYWDALVRSHDGDHAGVAALLTEALAVEREPAPYDYRRRELHLLYIESLLALGKVEPARAHGKLVLEREQNSDPLILAHLSAGDVTAIEQVAARHAGRDLGQVSLPYHDPRFDPLLTDPRFVPLRRQHPPGLEYDDLREQVTLLLPEGAVLSPQSVVELIATTLPEASVTRLALDSESVQTLEARHGESRWLVAIGSQPYAPPEQLEELSLRDPKLREALLAHRSWIEIGCDEHADKAAALRFPAALAAGLDPPPGSILYLDDVSRMALWDDRLNERLQNASGARELEEIGETAFLYFDGDDQIKPLISRRAWRTLERSFQNRGLEGVPFRVKVELSLGRSRERIWLKVERIEEKPAWLPTAVGIAESDSLLHTSLKSGEPRQFNRYQVLAVDPEKAPANTPNNHREPAM